MKLASLWNVAFIIRLKIGNKNYYRIMLRVLRYRSENSTRRRAIEAKFRASY